MSGMREIASDLCADAQIILFLHDKDYQGLLNFIDAQYGLKFLTEQTGASFEDCIDWCAQNAGGLENARHVLWLLFGRYYLRLPRPVKADLLYLAEEVGFDPRRAKLDELKALCRAEIKCGASRAMSLPRFAWVLLSNMRLKLKVIAAVRSAGKMRPIGEPIPASGIWPLWIGEVAGEPERLKRPYPGDDTTMLPRSTHVSGVKNNDPSLIESIELSAA